MKNFFRFLLVFVGVILLYIYNNPDVIDKYKTTDASADKDTIQSVEPVTADSQIVNATAVDSVLIDSIKKESVDADSL